MSTLRVLKGSTVTVTETLTDGLGAPLVPTVDTATVIVTNSAGVELANEPATPTGNPNEFSTTLTSVATADLDALTLTWTSSAGAYVSQVQVVGGFLFTIAELRAQATVLADVVKYPTSKLTAVRSAVEDALEEEIGFALVPRYGQATFANASSTLRLTPFLRRIRTVNDAASDLTVDTLDLRFDAVGYVTGYWFQGPTIVGYEYGLDNPPARATSAGLMLAKTWAITGPIDDRTTNYTSPDTGITSTLATPGLGGSIFGLPAVDQWVTSARLIGVA